MDLRSQNMEISETFVARLTDAQLVLFNYISYLIGNCADARDVLQETNLDLWRKAGTYDVERPFLPWARAIARYQVLTFRKRQSRDRLLFDEELLETAMAQPQEKDEENLLRMFTFLKQCREKLSDLQKSFVKARYENGGSLRSIAQEYGCSVPSVGMALMRIRSTLAQCVRGRLAEEGS